MIKVITNLIRVPDKVYDWLDIHVRDDYWTSHPVIYRDDVVWCFYFESKPSAVLFKLTWGGVDEPVD